MQQTNPEPLPKIQMGIDLDRGVFINRTWVSHLGLMIYTEAPIVPEQLAWLREEDERRRNAC